MNKIFKIGVVLCLLMTCLNSFAFDSMQEWNTLPDWSFNPENFNETTTDLPLLRVGAGDPNDPNNETDPELGLLAPGGDIPIELIMGTAIIYILFLFVRGKEELRMNQNS